MNFFIIVNFSGVNYRNFIVGLIFCSSFFGMHPGNCECKMGQKTFGFDKALARMAAVILLRRGGSKGAKDSSEQPDQLQKNQL